MRKSFLTDYLETFATQIAVTLSGIIVLKLLAHQFPEKDFGTYLIIKRVVMFFLPVLTLNLSLSLARFLSINRSFAKEYFYYAVRIVSLFSLIFLVLSAIFDESISIILFNTDKYSATIMPIMIFIYVTGFHFISIGYFRGRQEYSLMNLLYILYWAAALFGLLLLLVFPNNYIQFIIIYLYFNSVLIFFGNLLILKKRTDLFISMNLVIKSIKEGVDKNHIRQLRDFGLKRLPQGIFFAAIFFLPMIVTSNNLSLKEAAYIGIVISIIRLLQITVNPFNQLFVPKFSQFISENNKEAIKYYSQLIIEFFFSLPMLIGLLVYFMSHEIIVLWFGQKYSTVSAYLMIATPAIGFFLIYILIRGILDGIYEFPYSIYITSIGCMATIIGLIYSVLSINNLMGITLAFAVGLMSLGISSLFILIRKQQLSILTKNNFLAIGWLIIAVIIIEGANKLVIDLSLFQVFLMKSFVSVFVILISLYFYYYVKFPWVKEVIQRFKSK